MCLDTYLAGALWRWQEIEQKGARPVSIVEILASKGRSVLRPYKEKKFRSEEDGFALEHFDGEEEGDGGVGTSGRKMMAMEFQW